MKVTPPRRLACALTGIGAAALVLHAQLADALVTRGDDALRAGDEQHAVAIYRRALVFDPASRIAAGRLAFHLAIRHRAADAREAVGLSTRALAGGADPDLLAARAFAELVLRDWTAAANDFERAARSGGDPRFARLARRVAQR